MSTPEPTSQPTTTPTTTPTADSTTPEPTASPSPSPAPTKDPTPSTNTPVVGQQVQGGHVLNSYVDGSHPGGLNGAVDLAKADLAQRIGADVGAISVVLVQEVIWSDGGLGCPLPGMMYIQVTVEGLRIVLAHDGVAYDYRTEGTTTIRFCK